MKNKLFIVACLSIMVTQYSYAQNERNFWNDEMVRIATPTSNEDWINIKPDIRISATSFFVNEKNALGLSFNDEMRLFKTETDKIGFTHYRYYQYNSGYRILGAEFFLHEKDGRLITANGKMVKGLYKNIVINISANDALQKALLFLPATKYAWEVVQLENNYKQIMHNNTASYKPVAELVWISTDILGDFKNIHSYELSYVYDIYPASMNGKRIFVSAVDGRIIKSLPLSSECDATSAFTNFYGSQGFSTRLIPGSAPARWNLWNDCSSAYVHTRQWLSDATSNEYISSAANIWSAIPSAATSHWCTEKAAAYFLGIHGRNGWNGALFSGAGVDVYQDALFCSTPGCTPTSPNNASMSFSGGIMKVGNSGNAATIDDWNTVDIIAHEFTHAVTASSAGLIYQKESGGLNESFSDIFGVTCQAWLFGINSNTWKVGYDRKDPANNTTSLYLRNMANPNDKGDPDTYLGTNWVSTTTPTDVFGDNWGVHSNSGVQNYMYYLLVSGGSGVNDFGTAFSMVGVGIVAARAIGYRALTVYLTSNASFADARRAWVLAAVDLYGECSFQAIETGKAWNAVGLAPPLSNSFNAYCGSFGATLVSLTSAGTFSLAPGCNYIVNPASLVQYGANRIEMHPGFRANNGSHFRAYVSDCRFAAH
jgi:bacillolysin